MRILHLCNKVPFPGRDGSSLAMEALIRLEVAAGYKVTVCALNSDKHFVANPTPPEGIELVSFRATISPRWYSAWRQLWHPASFFAARFEHESVRKEVRSRAKMVDLIVVDSLFMGLYVNEFGQTPWVLRTHNVEFQIWNRTLKHMRWSPKKWFVEWQSRRLEIWERQMIQGRHVWAISEEDAEEMRSIGAKSTTVFPCTFDHHNQWHESGASGKGIYHLGALDWLPNVQGLKWYIEEVHPLVNDEVTVISKTWPSGLERPDSILHESDLQGRFSFSDHGIFIAPILSGSGMRIKLLEAMARGKAIVTTQIGAEGLYGAQGVLAVDSPEEFAEAINQCICDDQFRIHQGKASRAHAVAKFADQNFVESMRVATQKMLS